MSETPVINMKDIPEDVNNLILDKQTELKKKNKSMSKSQVVIILLKEAYLKEKK